MPDQLFVEVLQPEQSSVLEQELLSAQAVWSPVLSLVAAELQAVQSELVVAVLLVVQ